MNFSSPSNCWTIINGIEASIKAKISEHGKKLSEWNISIYRGILTGYNEAFIIDSQKKEELIREDPKSAEIIRPILRGRDIKKYSFSFADLWLIALFPSRHYDIEDYPAIKSHLLSFGIERLEQTGNVCSINGEIVRARKKTNNKWYETQDSISYWDDFSKQKIVYREISDEMDACIVSDEVYVNNKCYIITGENLEHLICVLNSKLFNKIILKGANQTGGKGRDFLEKIHIPYPNNDKELEELYKKLSATSPAEKETILKQIDYKVSELYDLTNAEIDYINSL